MEHRETITATADSSCTSNYIIKQRKTISTRITEQITLYHAIIGQSKDCHHKRLTTILVYCLEISSTLFSCIVSVATTRASC